MTFLQTPIEFLKGVGPARSAMLQKELGVHTYEDLLMHFPFRYVDRSQVVTIDTIAADASYVVLKGIVNRPSLLHGIAHIPAGTTRGVLQALGHTQRKTMTGRSLDHFRHIPLSRATIAMQQNHQRCKSGTLGQIEIIGT